MKTILVIDDNTLNLRMASFVLEKNGYEAVTVKSGQEGLDWLKGAEADLVLLDIEMPVMNGFETFDEMKKMGLDVPVMFLTASENQNDLRESMRLGAVGYVKKPFVPEDFAQRVANVLEAE